jgi:hypothetical protein
MMCLHFEKICFAKFKMAGFGAHSILDNGDLMQGSKYIVAILANATEILTFATNKTHCDL